MNDYPMTELGQHRASVAVVKLLNRLDFPDRVFSDGIDEYDEYTRKGMALVFTVANNMLTTAMFYFCGRDGYAEYTGGLPFGLQANMNAIQSADRPLVYAQ